MDTKMIIVVMGFTILISLQYTMNRILKEIRDIKEILKRNSNNVK